jgi:hypothetical protein
VSQTPHAALKIATAVTKKEEETTPSASIQL